ncbi:hypothetical protein A4A49_57545, partial [Nicotiana attenuata]
QLQTTNKYAVLEDAKDGDVQGKQLAIIEEMALGAVQSDPKSPGKGKNGAVQNNQQQVTTFTGRLNPAAQEFNPNSAGIESTNGGANGKEIPMGRETTSQWVKRAFKANDVGTNTSCQEIPSQDTMVDRELANNPEIQANDIPVLKVGERDQRIGGRLWSDQRKIDSEEDEVPLGAQPDKEPIHEDKEEEEQSVNGNAIVTTNNADVAPIPGRTAEIEVTQDRQEEQNIQGNIEEAVRIDAVDPGGTGRTNDAEELASMEKDKGMQA